MSISRLSESLRAWQSLQFCGLYFLLFPFTKNKNEKLRLKIRLSRRKGRKRHYPILRKAEGVRAPPFQRVQDFANAEKSPPAENREYQKRSAGISRTFFFFQKTRMRYILIFIAGTFAPFVLMGAWTGAVAGTFSGISKLFAFIFDPKIFLTIIGAIFLLRVLTPKKKKKTSFSKKPCDKSQQF